MKPNTSSNIVIAIVEKIAKRYSLSAADMTKLILESLADIHKLSGCAVPQDHHDDDRTLSAGRSHADTPPLTPAVPIEDSVQDDYIVCLEDGEPFKMMKRHLSARHGMTPDQYRNKWGLVSDYPMIAPSCPRRNSGSAQCSGLGRNPQSPKRWTRWKTV